MTEPYITDIDKYNSEFNYYYYSQNSSANNADKYMSKTQLTSEQLAQISNLTKSEIVAYETDGTDGTFCRDDIITSITYVNGEGITLTYKFGAILKLYDELHRKYNYIDGVLISDNRKSAFKCSLGNLFGFFAKYMWYNEAGNWSEYRYKPANPDGPQRKVGLLHDNIQIFYFFTQEYSWSGYTLPDYLSFEYRPLFSRGYIKDTDILEEIIRGEHDTLSMENQLLLINGFTYCFDFASFGLYEAPFYFKDIRTWFYYVVYANDNGKSVLTLLDEARQTNTVVDVSPYMDIEHLWICEYIDSSEPLNADRPRIQVRMVTIVHVVRKHY